MLKTLLDKELIFVNPHVKDKDGCFTLIAQALQKQAIVDEPTPFYDGLWQREKMKATDLVAGIAIPHVRAGFVHTEKLVILVSRHGIPYTKGREPVHILICIASTEYNRKYLNVLARVAALLKDERFVAHMKAADVPEDVLFLIRKFETKKYAPQTREGTPFYLIGLLLHEDIDVSSVLSIFMEMDISNVTMLKGEYGMERMAKVLPFFSPFSLGRRLTRTSRLFVGFSADAGMVHSLETRLQEEGIDLNKRGTGSLFSCKLCHFAGGFDLDMEL